MFGLFRKRDPNKDRNDRLRADLRAKGDGSTMPRFVRHYVSPAAGGGINTSVVKEYLYMNALVVDKKHHEFGFVAEETREVASEGFDAATAKLGHAMKAWNWTYDGWDCAVEMNGERST